jgi:glycosyltransferase involved in cell wall biosynthesis
MRVVFLFMSKQFTGRAQYRAELLARARTSQASAKKIKTWTGAILAGLARRGHRATHVCFETEAYIRARFGVEAAARSAVAPGFDALWTSRPEVARPLLAAADAILVRNTYPAYGEIFAGLSLAGRRVIVISVSHATRIRFVPGDAELAVLVNSREECADLRRRGSCSDVFRKPAHDLFYEAPGAPPPKTYDAAFVAWETATARKRFDLVLDALAWLRDHGQRRLSLLVAGDSTAHEERIEREFRPPARVEVHRIGRVGREELRDLYHRCRLTVVASDRDANPQVIAESLACNVPVACASDITGGAFQITPATGELFAPTPQALAATILTMLDRIDTYAARAHCITIDQAVDQIESLIRKRVTRTED